MSPWFNLIRQKSSTFRWGMKAGMANLRKSLSHTIAL